ncbi:MAE_28990/MAE_18760 family HEPN-like nuclease [Lentzea sp. NPDC060358]|uniref:MAE_28990/MAE_18760 family HEPN-like nuclease n=1 Tax=Lentzea sp. NPDC060358 TaxID=3347103 RepID=UPI00365AE634
MRAAVGTEAIGDFIESVQEVELLLRADEAPENALPSPGERRNRRDLKNALCRAGLLMLVAHFEGYVKAALAEFLDEVNGAKPPSRRIPDSLLELFTRDRIQEILRLDDGTQRIHKTRKLFNVYSVLWDDDRAVNPSLLSSRVLARQFTNAKAESLEHVLGLIGVEDALQRVEVAVRKRLDDNSPEATRVNLSAKLKEIVEKRNRIAHGDLTEKPTVPEVRAYLTFLLCVARSLDELFVERIGYCCSLR